MRNRSDLDIMSTILSCADTESGTQKTKLMFGAFLSTTQLKYYLDRLAIDKLIVYDKRSKLYKTTKKGLTLIDKYKIMKEMLPVVEIS